jgi:hypothetical protein
MYHVTWVRGAAVATIPDDTPQIRTRGGTARRPLTDPEEEEDLDNSEVRLKNVLSATYQEEAAMQHHGHITKCKKGSLKMIADTEDIDKLPMVEDKEKREEEGQGK